MLSSLSFLLALGLFAAEQPQLEILNPRATFGHLGAPRPRTGSVPGEVVHFAFDVKGMSQDKHGRAQYSLLMEVLNDKKEAVFRMGPKNAVAISFLGGDVVPCAAHMEVPVDMPAGNYLLRVSIEDRSSGRKATFQGNGKILPANFSLVRVGTFADHDGKAPKAPIGSVGETLYINFAAAHFARNGDTKQPDISVSLRVLDEQGKQASPEPLTGRAHQDIPEDYQILPMQFAVTLNRTGRFTLELTAKDEITGATSQVTLPLLVYELLPPKPDNGR